MKTTVDLADALAREAKRHAARHGLTLRAVIEEAIRSTLRGETGSRAAFVLRDASVDGSGMQAEFRRRSPVEASGRHVRRAGRLTAADTPC